MKVTKYQQRQRKNDHSKNNSSNLGLRIIQSIVVIFATIWFLAVTKVFLLNKKSVKFVDSSFNSLIKTEKTQNLILYSDGDFITRDFVNRVEVSKGESSIVNVDNLNPLPRAGEWQQVQFQKQPPLDTIFRL